MSPHPAETYGADFRCGEGVLEGHAPGEARCVEVAVGIGPEKTPHETLVRAWAVVRELAAWLLEQEKSALPRTYYRIKVGWRAEVRKEEDAIFRLFADERLLRLMMGCESWTEYGKFSCERELPSPWWEMDVFRDPEVRKVYQAMVLDEEKVRVIGRPTVLAGSSTEAMRLLEERYGEGRVTGVYNEEDSEKPR